MSEFGRHRFRCSVERHLFKSGLALAVYSKLYGIVCKKGWVYHASKEALEKWFGCSRAGLAKAFKLLVKLGWLEELDVEPASLHQVRKREFRPKNYRVIQHSEWALTHSDECTLEVMPWDGEEKDVLGSDLWNASKGKLKWYSGQLKALRKSGLTDRELVARFLDFIEDTKRANDASGRYKPEYINWESSRRAFIKQMAPLRQPRTDPAPRQPVAA